MMTVTQGDVDVVLDSYDVYRSGAAMALKHVSCGRSQAVAKRLSIPQLVRIAAAHDKTCSMAVTVVTS